MKEVIKENFLVGIKKIFEFIGKTIINAFNIVRALLRLCLIMVTTFLSGIDSIIFSGGEVCGCQFFIKPQISDNEKVSYITKLNNQIGCINPMELEDGEEFYDDEEE